jgi:hypothetical protein
VIKVLNYDIKYEKTYKYDESIKKMTVCKVSLFFEWFFDAGVDDEVWYELVFSKFSTIDPNIN